MTAEVEVAGQSTQVADQELLRVDGITKRFGGTLALDCVSLSLGAGEVLALLGENGAGKSTLIKILAGVFAFDSGRIAYRGREHAGQSLRRLPVSFIHQDLGLIEWMTVAENICLTLSYPRKHWMIDWASARQRAAGALDQLGVDIDPDVRIQDLSRTDRSLVAIARALATQAEVLILDEPTASLPADEVSRLFVALQRLRARGVGMIYVSHRLDEVFDIADRVVVLRDGRVVGQRTVAQTKPEDLIVMIVGREPSQIFRRPLHRAGAARLVLDGVTVGGTGPVSTEIYAGEILGLVGLRGAGQESIGRALFGRARIDQGGVMLDGVPVAPSSPRDAMREGIHLIGADRLGDSVLPTLSICENLFLNPVAAGRGLFSYLMPERESKDAIAVGQSVGLRPNDPSLPIEMLSGGNQQKVVVGRWLHLRGKVYIFEDPTAGVDVGAKADIYRLFDVALTNQAAILVISTDFEEVAQICHRAIVFDRGRVVNELDATDLSVENLLAAASARVGQTAPKRTGAGHAND